MPGNEQRRQQAQRQLEGAGQRQCRRAYAACVSDVPVPADGATGAWSGKQAPVLGVTPAGRFLGVDELLGAPAAFAIMGGICDCHHDQGWALDHELYRTTLLSPLIIWHTQCSVSFCCTNETVKRGRRFREVVYYLQGHTVKSVNFVFTL